jgi:hypothetical protein
MLIDPRARARLLAASRPGLVVRVSRCKGG